ncbi:hypothetical protein PFMALIP_05795, partial [Plasmodium falciparum MaliPS096_E11]
KFNNCSNSLNINQHEDISFEKINNINKMEKVDIINKNVNSKNNNSHNNDNHDDDDNNNNINNDVIFTNFCTNSNSENSLAKKILDSDD